MNWKIAFTVKAQAAFNKLDTVIRRRIEHFINNIPDFPDGPRMRGEPLQGPLAGLWKYRIGDYRLVCRIKDDVLTVLVVWLGHRREVYRKQS